MFANSVFICQVQIGILPKVAIDKYTAIVLGDFWVARANWTHAWSFALSTNPTNTTAEDFLVWGLIQTFKNRRRNNNNFGIWKLDERVIIGLKLASSGKRNPEPAVQNTKNQTSEPFKYFEIGGTRCLWKQTGKSVWWRSNFTQREVWTLSRPLGGNL